MKKTIFMLAIFLLANYFNSKAQVTIGSGNLPAKAAILELKDREANSENVTSESGGLVLPRVKLENSTTLQPFIKLTDTEWSSANINETRKVHTGLMVYNLNTTGGFQKGVYIWDGSQWKLSGENSSAGDNAWFKQGNPGTNPTTNFMGTTDASGLSIRTNSTERIRISDTGNVGIGTANPAQKLEVAGNTAISNGTLTVGGKTYLKTVNTAPESGVSQVAVDNSTGELYAIKAGDNTKAFSYIKYSLTTGEASGDWILNFNTSIPESQYTVIVVGSGFRTVTKDEGLLATPYSKNGATYNPLSVYAFQEGGTWRITADYVGGRTADGKKGTWDVYCLIINKSVVQTLTSKAVSLPSNVGSAPKPAGL